MLEIAGAVLDRALTFLTENWLALATIFAAGLLVRLRRPLRASRVLRFFAWPTAVGALVAAALSLAASLAVFTVRGEPLPLAYDDVSHLLLGDTLLHGRLANPPHPFGRYFETVVFHEPTYASQYPPGTGFVLALGAALFHLPIAGIWIVSAAAAAAVVWAARAWLSRSWSVIAGLIVAIHPTVTFWNTVYYGGSVPLLAGALLLGATGRLVRRPTARNACVAAVAIVMLANSRQFEGLLLSVAMFALVLIQNPRRVPAIVRASPAAIAILLAGAIFIGVFNKAVTGSAFVLPHALYDRTHNPGPNFIWQTGKTYEPYGNEESRYISRPYVSHHARLRAPGGVLRLIGDKVVLMKSAITAPEADGTFLHAGRLLLFLPLLMFFSAIRKRHFVALVVALAISLFAPFATSWWLSRHYLSPAGALVLVIYLLLARRALAFARGRGGWILIVALIVVAGVSTEFIGRTSRRPQEQKQVERREIALRLERMGGEHLILVPTSIYFVVYNGADLERAPVLWARQPDVRDEAALLRHYARRRLWRLTESEGHLALAPFR